MECVAAVGPGCTHRSVSCWGSELRGQRSEHQLISVCCLSVSSQVEVKVEGVVGDDVLLPCSYPGLQLPPESLNVSWRNQGDQMVLGIDGAQNLTHQDQKFRGRVSSFPHLYRHGNFSVVLQDVQQLDGGLYECDMVVHIRQKVRLHVSAGEWFCVLIDLL